MASKLNGNTSYTLSLVLVFQDKGNFHMNMRLRMYKYRCSNLDALYVKGLLTQDYKDNKVLLKKTAPKRSLERNTVIPEISNWGTF